MSVVIRVNNLSKHYGEIKAVDDISFTVNEGEIYGFLGQNGAGKSTTIRILLTLIEPTHGNIEIFGSDLHTNRKEILTPGGSNHRETRSIQIFNGTGKSFHIREAQWYPANSKPAFATT